MRRFQPYRMDANGTILSEETVLTPGDASWVVRNAFLVLTMQSGFSLLEAGCVSGKNTTNIMVKNIMDVVVGGIMYWAIGFGLSFGTNCNPFCCVGNFFLSPTESNPQVGSLYMNYFFQFSFASTATTIFSGAVAERIRFEAYVIFSVFNVIIYAIPAFWVWNPQGFLNKMGFHDFAGACVVHLSGGSSALVGAWILGPRTGRFTKNDSHGMASPVTALTGTLLLWWAWFGFNCGSTLSLQGDLWKVAGKVATTTMNGSIGGVLTAMALDMIIYRHNRRISISHLCSGILGGLVGITAGCAVITPIEALVVGGIAAAMSIGSEHLLEKLKIDDPVAAVPVHMSAGLWGTIAVGLFGSTEFDQMEHPGLFRGGGFRMLGVQTMGSAIFISWNMLLTLACLCLIKISVGLRSSEKDEAIGADWTYHKIGIGPSIKNLLRVTRPGAAKITAIGNRRTGRTSTSAVTPFNTKEGDKKIQQVMKDLASDEDFRAIIANHLLLKASKLNADPSTPSEPDSDLPPYTEVAALRGIPFLPGGVNLQAEQDSFDFEIAEQDPKLFKRRF